MLKKFGLEDSKPIKTPMSSETKLTRDVDGESVDDTKYCGMIGSLLYLTASWSDIMFSVYLCARFKEDPKSSHLEAKQTALAISTTKAEYVSTGKACVIDLSKNPVLHSRTKHIEIRHHFLRDNVQKGNISIEKVSSEDNIADILTKPLKREPFNLLRLGRTFGLTYHNTAQLLPCREQLFYMSLTTTSAYRMCFHMTRDELEVHHHSHALGAQYALDRSDRYIDLDIGDDRHFLLDTFLFLCILESPCALDQHTHTLHHLESWLTISP
ncbi:hypothetical protein Tco_1561330 [Tanacetum coccineum]